MASGVNAMLVPEAGGAAVSHVRALAPDGRCKSFGAEGDGYGRGEVPSLLSAFGNRTHSSLDTPVSTLHVFIITKL